MKTKIIITVYLYFKVLSLFSQNQSSKLVSSDAKRFYYFEIPSSINGSNIDPSPISNVTSSFTDSKLSFKLGFPSLFKEAPASKKLKHTGFIQTYVKATNGITTLWKSEAPPVEFGLTAGYSLVLKHHYWVFLDAAKNKTTNHSSESIYWLNFLGNIERGNYNIFNESGIYDQLITKEKKANGNFYISVNGYFFSKIKKYRWRSMIWGLGVGYSNTNNYSYLKNRTFEKGKLVYNSDSTLYQTVVETTSGRLGNFKIYNGFSAFGELYMPIIRSAKYGSLFFGNKLTFYGIGGKDYILNYNSGFYVNIKDQKVNGDIPAKDVVNFSVSAQFNQINKAKESDYIKQNLSILVQAAIPLRFN